MKKLALIALLAACVAAAVPVTGAQADSKQKRVIVELAVPGGNSSSEIAAVTDELLGSLPAGSYTLLNRYVTLPYVALSAGPSALSVLRQSDLVVSVYDDGVVSAAAKHKKCKRHGKSKKTCRSGRTTQKGVH